MGQFISENGFYVAVKTRLEDYAEAFRSGLLSRKLRGCSIRIGKGSYLRGLNHIRIGENFRAGRGLWLEAITELHGETYSPTLIIGDNVTVAFWSHIAAANYVEIGSNVLLGSKVIITDHNHGSYGPEVHSSPATPPVQRALSHGRVVIGRNVWIGDGVVVAPGSDIGEGCIIGANSVVTGSIPPYTIAVGTPARAVKRFDFVSNEWVNSGKSNEDVR